MKKRILTGIVGFCTVLSLVGCGNGAIRNDKITIKQYKGLEVEKVEVADITDEDIDESIASTLVTLDESYGIKDRAVADGDTVIMNYVGKIDGEEFEGGTVEKESLKIGSDAYIPGFEDAIIGHMPGTTFDINVTFPEEYTEELAGKDAVFTITLLYIVPEMTEELVPALSQTAKTLEEYRAEVKEALRVSNEESAKTTLEQSLWGALIEQCDIKTYPEDKLQEVKNSLESQYSYTATYYGVDVSTLLENAYGITLEEMAQNLIKQEFATELIAEKEGLTITAEDYDKGLAEYAERYGYDNVEEFETLAGGKEEVEKSLQQKKVAAFLVEHCKQVEKESE